MQITWTKENALLLSNAHYLISETAYTVSNHTNGTNLMYFESDLTIHALKLADNGTYTCTAVVVVSSTGQALSSPVFSSMVMRVVGEYVAL